jgi:tetratricopeptide (TPR) repeat protein
MRPLLLTLCLLVAALAAAPVAAQERSDETAESVPNASDATAEADGSNSDASDAADGEVPEEDAETAAPAPPPNLDRQARRLFVAGRTAYQEGRFDEAASLWERAFDLSGRATLLLGLGDAYDRLREGRRAASVLRQYLVLEPDTDSREHLEARIELLLRDDHAPTRRRRITYVLAAGAGAAAIISGVYWARARSRYDALAATCGGTPEGCADGQIGNVRRAQRVSRAALGISLGAAVGAVVTYFLEGRRSAEDRRRIDERRARRRARRGSL